MFATVQPTNHANFKEIGEFGENKKQQNASKLLSYLFWGGEGGGLGGAKYEKKELVESLNYLGDLSSFKN